ncbi:alpha-N-acetylneuraminide alpha-2,8-sialyltransferase-like [Branchiostoma floridae]|uniref:Alpha-N-acetylneuraminide alpha-2,8-sialyltransferase-like n=1 Tax=Branchiostoma floridae TaxID=7739 RepID=A0A9J7M392_BRAFL|nr:alpha-N-acetylneuraminide alpha-2,8-sialyltransferase-like [Branchiostoma floridae]
MRSQHRRRALLLVSLIVVPFLLYYTSARLIPGDMLSWSKLETRANTSSSLLELEEADSDYSGGLEGVTGTANSSMEKPKAGGTRPLQEFANYAKYIPKESVALKKFIADQAAVQSIPTEAPGWVYNKTAAELFRNRVIRDSRYVNGSFLVTQGNVVKNVLKTYGKKPTIVKVPSDVFKGFPKESPFKNKRFNTCSLVGNGGILTGSGCGKEIDASEFVFRFNMAPMYEEYLEDIGKKTSLITINPSMIRYRYNYGGTRKVTVKTINVRALMSDLSVYGDSYLWIWAFETATNADHAFKAQQALQGNSARNQVILPYPRVTGSMKSFWKNNGIRAQKASSGLLFVGLATQLCEEVHLYGFWPFHSDRNNRRLTEHYYDNAFATKFHRISDEFRQLQHLHNTGVLRLTTRACQ